MCIYEQINTAFACIAMDLQTLKDHEEDSEKVNEIEQRIQRNITAGQTAVKILADQAKAIQETLLTIYPVNMGSNLDNYMQGVEYGKKQAEFTEQKKVN